MREQAGKKHWKVSKNSERFIVDRPQWRGHQFLQASLWWMPFSIALAFSSRSELQGAVIDAYSSNEAFVLLLKEV